VSYQRTSEAPTRALDDIVEDPPEHRRRTARQDRHTTRSHLHKVSGDGDALEDADLVTRPAHDLGRHTGAAPKATKPGRRSGFKVWKTPFWKRRRSLWAEQNAAARRLREL
jgi:hypothetical protein